MCCTTDGDCYLLAHTICPPHVFAMAWLHRYTSVLEELSCRCARANLDKYFLFALEGEVQEERTFCTLEKISIIMDNP